MQRTWRSSFSQAMPKLMLRRAGPAPRRAARSTAVSRSGRESDRCPHSMRATSRNLVDQVKHVIIAIEDVANAPGASRDSRGRTAGRLPNSSRQSDPPISGMTTSLMTSAGLRWWAPSSAWRRLLHICHWHCLVTENVTFGPRFQALGARCAGSVTGRVLGGSRHQGQPWQDAMFIRISRRPPWRRPIRRLPRVVPPRRAGRCRQPPRRLSTAFGPSPPHQTLRRIRRERVRPRSLRR
jgi:hypothetical protein